MLARKITEEETVKVQHIESVFNGAGSTVGGYDEFMCVEQAAIEGEDLAARISAAAHHEAGHVVIAASRGLALRAEGIMVGQDASGLACFCKRPQGTDASVEAIIIASFAGCYAENYFRNLRGYQVRDYWTIQWSLDWKEARGIEGQFSDVYRGGRIIPTVHTCWKIKRSSSLRRIGQQLRDSRMRC